MNVTTLRTAIAEAERFLTKAKAVPIEHSSAMMAGRKWDAFAPYSNRETAACKRASMDLSMALSDLRKP